MKITRSNYESWFLDYLEGNLGPSVEVEFQAFLNLNPDLAAELEENDWITLPTDKDVHFASKEQLKKSEIDAEIDFQERAIAYHEGDLPVNEKKSLKRRILVFPLCAKLAAAAAIVIFGYFLYKPEYQIQRPLKRGVAVINKQTDKDSVLTERKTKHGDKPTIKVPQFNQPRKVPPKPKGKSVEEKPEKSVVPNPHLRLPEAEPSLLKLKGINLGQPGDVELAVMTLKKQENVEGDLVLSEIFKAQLGEIRQSGDRELLSTEHLGVAGLHLFAKLTGKRLTAHKAGDGIVTSISYDSKILAFSIPVNR